jgi:hypothetical protein
MNRSQHVACLVTGQYGRDPFSVHVWWFLGTRGVAKGPGQPPWALCFFAATFRH